MAKFHDSQRALAQVAEDIQNAINDKNADVHVHTGYEKMDIPPNSFILLFYSSLKSLIREFHLSPTDIVALLQIAEYMEYGNLFRMSYAQLARDIGIDPRNLSKTVKKLKDSKILIEHDGNSYINPQVLIKGRFKRKDEKGNKLIEYGAKLFDEIGYSPNIFTSKMRSDVDFGNIFNKGNKK